MYICSYFRFLNNIIYTNLIIRMKHLISNFLFLYRKGLDIYFCIKNLLPFLDYFYINNFIYLYVANILSFILLLLLSYYFIIQYFLFITISQLSILFNYKFSKYDLVNYLH